MAEQLGAEQDWAARLKRALLQGAVAAPQNDAEIAPVNEADTTPAAPPAIALLATLGLPPVPGPVGPSLAGAEAAQPAPVSLFTLLEPMQPTAQIVPTPESAPASLLSLLPALAEPTPEQMSEPVVESESQPTPALLASPVEPVAAAKDTAEPSPIDDPASPAPTFKAAEPEPGFVPGEFEAAFAALLGRPPGQSALQAGAAHHDEWIALFRSMTGIEGTWHSLTLGGGGLNMIMAACLGAKRQGLVLRHQVVEADSEIFQRLYEAVSAREFTSAEIVMTQAEISFTADELAPRAAAADQMFSVMPRCDYLRVSMRGVLLPLLATQMDILTSKLRWLVITTRNRAEEHQALTLLGSRGWQLMADHPCTIDRLAPPRVSRPGTQIWRGPNA